MTQAKIYFLKQSNSVEADGPFTLKELQTKELNNDTPIYTSSSGEWKKASSFAELLPIIHLREASEICDEEGSSETIENFPEIEESPGEGIVNVKPEEIVEDISTTGERAESTINVDVQESSNLSFWQAYMRCWRKYGDFSGRARRLEYWSFQLMLLFACVILFFGMGFALDDYPLGWVVYVASIIYVLAAIVPSLSSQVRRLHDSGLSGWNILWAAFPSLGGLILLVLTLRDSEKGPNKWGPNPKGQ